MVNREVVRTELLQAAGETFAAEGYQNATVRKICQRAGANVAAVNYYFGDKERLYLEAVTHARQLIERRWPLPAWSAEVAPEARLKSFLDTLLSRLLSPPTTEWQVRLLLREIIEPTGAGEQLVREGFLPFFQVLLDIIRALVPAGVPLPQLQQIGFSILGQCVFYRAHHRAVAFTVTAPDRAEHFTVEPLAEHIFRFSLAAIRGMTDVPPEVNRDTARAVDAGRRGRPQAGRGSR